jgi:hypothetical protein
VEKASKYATIGRQGQAGPAPLCNGHRDDRHGSLYEYFKRCDDEWVVRPATRGKLVYQGGALARWDPWRLHQVKGRGRQRANESRVFLA